MLVIPPEPHQELVDPPPGLKVNGQLGDFMVHGVSAPWGQNGVTADGWRVGFILAMSPTLALLLS